MTKVRRPGDQAPPPRAPHRNDHLKTATTHIKDTEGKLFCVHDGSHEMNILRFPNGKEMSMLEWSEARKAKDVAVTKLKQRQATIAELDLTGSGAPVELEMGAQVQTRDDSDSFNVKPTDPQLAQNQAKVIAAVRPVAAAAQQRAQQVQRAPGWTPAPKVQPATGKAAGWEAPPQGVSAPLGGAKIAPVVDPNRVRQQQGSASGFVGADGKPAAPTAGKTAAAPTATAGGVRLDDPNAPEEEGDSIDMSDLVVNADLETDVKIETERAVDAAKKLWSTLSAEEQNQVKGQVLLAADSTKREQMFQHMDPEQITHFETLEGAYHLLFGLPPQPAQPSAEAKAP